MFVAAIWLFCVKKGMLAAFKYAVVDWKLRKCSVKIFYEFFVWECFGVPKKCIMGYMTFRFTTFTTVSSLQRSCAGRKWRWCYQPLAALPSPLTPRTWPLEPSNYTPDTFQNLGFNDVTKSHKSAGSELTESLILKGLWRGGLCEPNQPYIWIPHVFLHMVTNFQLSRTTSWGIINFCETPFATRPISYRRDSNQMCNVTSLVSYWAQW